MAAGTNIAVLEGKEGWLFLEGFGPHSVLKEAQDLTSWRKHLLPKHIANYVARHNRVTERGIPFFVVFAPEAAGIYPEMLPPPWTIEFPTAAEVLTAELEKRGVNVVCASEELRVGKLRANTYRKQDSHWELAGAYLCYRKLVEKVREVLPVHYVDDGQISFNEKIVYGDLGVHMVPERSCSTQSVEIAGYTVTTASKLFDLREKSFRHTQCAGANCRALIFRDSFANALSPFLERTFADLFLIAPSPTMLDDAIDRLKPEVVILEVAERALYQEEFAFSDWDARSFEQIYMERAANPVGAELQIEAMTLIEGGRPEMALARAAAAIAIEGDRARLGYLSWALLNLGEYQLCKSVTSNRLSEDDKFIHYLYAQSCFRLGDLDSAFSSINKCISLQPNNGLYLYTLGEWLFSLARYQEAYVVAQKAVKCAPLHKRSWDVLIESARQAGIISEANDYSRSAISIFGSL